MKTVKLPKFEWGRVDEQNAGHTKNEWGMQKNTQTHIEAYDLKWNIEKKEVN